VVGGAAQLYVRLPNIPPNKKTHHAALLLRFGQSLLQSERGPIPHMRHSVLKVHTRVFEIIERAKDEFDKASRAFDIFLVTLILLNVAAVILSSFSDLYHKYSDFLNVFEFFSVAAFTWNTLFAFGQRI
jgi:hypothetical protein